MEVICELAKSGECDRHVCKHYKHHNPETIGETCEIEEDYCGTMCEYVICVPMEDEK